MYSVPRTILPHGASFNGHPVTLHITYESTKDTFTLEVLEGFVYFPCNCGKERALLIVSVCAVFSADPQ